MRQFKPFLLLAFIVPAVNALASVGAGVSSSSKSNADEKAFVSSSSAQTKTRDCVIVGGGPVGLAAAITLSRAPHCYRVTVLEKTDGESAVTQYDPSRSFLYNVNSRGLQWFQQEDASIVHKLKKRGVDSTLVGFNIIAADPKVPMPPKPEEVKISSTVSVRTNRTSYWIPRHEMIKALEESCHEQNEQLKQKLKSDGKGGGGSITILGGKEVNSVCQIDGNDDGILEVRCNDGSSYEASLIVAADGINSSIRACLGGTKDNKADGNSNPELSSSSSWLRSNAKTFRIKKYKSPASGLILRALQFPPNFSLIDTDGSKFQTIPSQLYVFRGKNKGPRNFLSVGFLPMKDGTSVRPGNAIVSHDHETLKLKTGSECKEWFKDNFPRIPWDGLIDDAEWERFAQSKGTIFPHCQYSPGSSISNPNNGGLTGVVMVGDACHAFSPDIGQGINAGFLDVLALDRSLRGVDIDTGKKDEEAEPSNPLTLGKALAKYQSNRRLEHRALIRLARFGAPYQYNQPWYRHRVGKFLWQMNVAFRMVLNKLSKNLIPPVAMLMTVQRPDLSYQQIMRRADTTTLVLRIAVIALAVLGIVAKRGL